MALLVSDLITDAFLNLSVITVNETITAAMQTDGFNRSNDLLDSLSAEGLAVPNQVAQAFGLQAGVTGYTLGAAGTFATTGGLRAMKVTAWRAVSNMMSKGGRPLSMAEFGSAQVAAQQALAELTLRAAVEGVILTVPASLTAAVPSLVAADTNYPLINVRVWPPPSIGAGQIELDYWTPLANFATVNDAIALPQGFFRMLSWLLAQELFSRYGRPSLLQYVMEMAKDAKAALISQNAMAAPANPGPSAPQGQQ